MYSFFHDLPFGHFTVVYFVLYFCSFIWFPFFLVFLLFFLRFFCSFLWYILYYNFCSFCAVLPVLCLGRTFSLLLQTVRSSRPTPSWVSEIFWEEPSTSRRTVKVRSTIEFLAHLAIAKMSLCNNDFSPIWNHDLGVVVISVICVQLSRLEY